MEQLWGKDRARRGQSQMKISREDSPAALVPLTERFGQLERG
jgi:hypothetical protein